MKIGRKHLILPLGAGCVVATAAFIGKSQDSHHTNVEYRFWKWGLKSHDPSFARFLVVDRSLSESLQGRSEADIAKFFPNLRPSKPGARLDSTSRSADSDLKYLEIEGTNVLIRLKDGQFEQFWLDKT